MTPPRPLRPWPGTLRPVWTVAAYVGRSEATIRTWARALKIRSACDTANREVLVDIRDAQRVSDATPRRVRTPAA